MQEAVQGKLTAHWRQENPPTETGADLLARIRTEKADLIRQGKLRKEKPLPPITESEKPFELPEGWVWCRLGEVIELISGQHIESSNYNEKGVGIPYLTGPSDFGELYPVITKWTDKPKVLAINNDILITVKGSGVGKLNLCDKEQIVICRQLMSVRPTKINVRYVFNFLHKSYDLLQADKKGTGIPGIDRETILEKLLPLPSLAEQQAIVAQVEELLGQVSALEAENKQQQAEVGRLMQAVLRAAFAGKETVAEAQ